MVAAMNVLFFGFFYQQTVVNIVNRMSTKLWNKKRRSRVNWYVYIL